MISPRSVQDAVKEQLAIIRNVDEETTVMKSSPASLAKRRIRDRARRTRAKCDREYKAREKAVYADWADAEDAGLVQWACEPEQEDLRSFEPDFSCCDDPTEAKAEWYRLVERDGIWMYAAQYRLTEDHPWVTGDAIGGVEGTIKGTGYDVDLMTTCLDALDAARQTEADTLAVRATFAGVAT